MRDQHVYVVIGAAVLLYLWNQQKQQQPGCACGH